MKNVITNDTWKNLYLLLDLKRNDSKDPVDVEAFLAENNFPPIFESINFIDTKNLDNLYFKNSIFNNCTFKNSSFCNTHLNQVLARNCIFSKTNWNEAIFQDCHFKKCEFNETRMCQSGFFESFFLESKFLNSIFQNSSFSDSTYMQCNLQATDFSKCILQNILFSSCILTYSGWYSCKLKEICISQGEFDGACFWKNTNQNVIWINSNLAECLMLENSGEPTVLNCTDRHVLRPIIGMPWNFNARADYAPIIAQALRNSDAIPLKIEVEPDEISNDLLKQEIAASLAAFQKGIPSEIVGIPSEIFRRVSDDSEIGKLKSQAFSFLQHCQGLALPGGSDLQPEFYGAERDPRTDKVSDYRRSMIEFALLFCADQTNLPTMGTCRGAQLINVYFGGTLKQHVDNQCISTSLQPIHLSESSRKEEFLSYFGASLFPSISMHHQAIDKVGKNLEVICEYDGIPKLLLSSDNQFIASQIHPEVFANPDFLVGDFKPAKCGQLIYELFLKKILEKQHPKKRSPGRGRGHRMG